MPCSLHLMNAISLLILDLRGAFTLRHTSIKPAHFDTIKSTKSVNASFV